MPVPTPGSVAFQQNIRCIKSDGADVHDAMQQWPQRQFNLDMGNPGDFPAAAARVPQHADRAKAKAWGHDAGAFYRPADFHLLPDGLPQGGGDTRPIGVGVEGLEKQ